MSDKEFMAEVEDFVKKHPKDGSKIFVEIDSAELLKEFNVEIAAAGGRRCTKIAINPKTGEKICLKWEST
ncbi:MAG: hypothetical protein AAF438_10315 [Pseudomonadota bacterium]